MSLGSTLEQVCLAIVDCEHKTAPIDPLGDHFAVGTPAMRGNRINYEESRRISKETFLGWTRRLAPRQGDLLFAREAPVGPIVRLPPELNVAPGQRTVLLRPNPALVDSDYLFYLLSSPRQQARISAKAAGSTVAHLNVADVRRFRLPLLPPIETQRAIAEVLGALDDKIASNAVLVDGADGLVRAWFGLLRQASDAVVDFGALATNPRSLVDPAEADGQVYVGLEHVRRRNMWLTSSGLASDVTSTKAVFQPGDVLFGKLRPYFHKVVAAPGAGIASTDILVVRANQQQMNGFLLAALSSDEVVGQCSAASEGTRMPRTSWKDLARVEVPWPGKSAAARLSADVQALRALVQARIEESNQLAGLRDTLLPQLMSGKIRVKDAEHVVSEAV